MYHYTITKENYYKKNIRTYFNIIPKGEIKGNAIFQDFAPNKLQDPSVEPKSLAQGSKKSKLKFVLDQSRSLGHQNAGCHDSSSQGEYHDWLEGTKIVGAGPMGGLVTDHTMGDETGQTNGTGRARKLR